MLFSSPRSLRGERIKERGFDLSMQTRVRFVFAAILHPFARRLHQECGSNAKTIHL